MLRARDAMDRAYAEPLDIPPLASIAVVSEAHFIRTFRSVFGETPHRYLQRRRVERAMFLLRTTDRPVTDICFETGFGSLGHVQPDVLGHRRGVAERATAGAASCTRCRPASRWRGPDRARTPTPKRAVPEKRSAPAPFRTVDTMITSLAISQIFVLDQDEALDFYVGKLGLEVATDIDLGFMRWLTVRVPGDPAREILLETPKPPVYDPATTERRARDGHQGRIRRHAVLQHRRRPPGPRRAQGQGRRARPRSRPSRATGSTSASATRSATTSASPSDPPRRPETR